MTGAVEVDYLELLDAEGTVVGYVDPEGVAHEFPHVDGEPDTYPYDAAAEHGKVRTTGEPILVPESAMFVFDDEPTAGSASSPEVDELDGDADEG